MPRNFSLEFPLALLCALTAIPAQAGPVLVQRAFVSGNGDNLNVATNCPVTAPCKTFAGALPVVADKGEIVAMDTAPYGSVTINKNVTITAAPGVYAGISVFAGAGITIATPNISVVLRGLNINGQGGNNGISVTAGAKLSVENCVITNFTSGNGISVNALTQVQIVNTLIRDNFTGIVLNGGSTANISGAKVLANSVGIESINTSTAYISDTVVSGNDIGGIIASSQTNSGTSRAFVSRSTITGNAIGVSSEANIAGGTSFVIINDSLVTGNTIGLNQSVVVGTALFKSMGNNAVIDNITDVSGIVTALTLR